MANKIKKKVVFNKVKNPLEKSGMLGKEKGFTRVKDLIWKWEKEEEDLAKMQEASLKDIWNSKDEDVWKNYIKKKR